jgi:hypothetical protein
VRVSDFDSDGFSVHRRVFSRAEVEDLRVESQRLTEREKSSCIRNLRDKSALFNELAGDQRLTSLIPLGLEPVRSILFDKTAAQNWPVPWHQDLTIAVKEKSEREGYYPWSIKDGVPHVQPPIELLEAMRTLRIHLDHTPVENGALSVVPGSHRLGKIPKIKSTTLPGKPISIPCKIGDVLQMSPLILHSSHRSESPTHRRVLHFEYAPANLLHSDLEWHESLKNFGFNATEPDN